MKKIVAQILLFGFSSILCLSLSQAQSVPSLNSAVNQVLSNPTANPTPNPATTPVTTAPPTTTITPPVPPALAQPKPPAIVLLPTKEKFTEYQSFCRTNTYGENIFFSPEQKKSRLDMIQKKLNADSGNVGLKTILIKEHLRQQNWKAAEPLINENKGSLSEELFAIFKAQVELAKKANQAAIKMLENYLNENPNSVAAKTLLAEANKAILFYSEARGIYEDLNKNDRYALEICELLVLDSHHKDGEAMCLKAMNKFPQNPLPDIYLGILYREKEHFKEAISFFKSANKKKATEFATTCQGEVELLQTKYPEAIESFNQALKLNQYSERAHLGLATTAIKLKNYDLALTHFIKMCEFGAKDSSMLKKTYQDLELQKSNLAGKYFTAIQNCRN